MILALRATSSSASPATTQPSDWWLPGCSAAKKRPVVAEVVLLAEFLPDIVKDTGRMCQSWCEKHAAASPPESHDAHDAHTPESCCRKHANPGFAAKHGHHSL